MGTNAGHGAMASGQAAPPQAGQPTGDRSAEIEQYRAKKDEFENAIRQVEKHIRKKDGKLALEVTDPARIGVDPTLFQVLREALDETNRRAQSREFSLDDVQLETPDLATAADQPAARGTGWSGVQKFWWGYRVFLNDQDSHTLIKLLWGAATTAAVTAALTNVLGAAPAGTVVAICTIAAWALDTVCAGGGHDGLYFNFAWPAIPWGFWSQP